MSVHSFLGEANNSVDMRSRLAETKAIGWWSENVSESPHVYTRDIVAVGDFNTPSEDDMELAEAMNPQRPAHHQALECHTHQTRTGSAAREPQRLAVTRRIPSSRSRAPLRAARKCQAESAAEPDEPDTSSQPTRLTPVTGLMPTSGPHVCNGGGLLHHRW